MPDNLKFGDTIKSEPSNDIGSSMNVIGLDYYETKIDKLNYEKKSDKNTMIGMRITGAAMALIGGAATIFESVKMSLYLAWPLIILGVLIFLASYSNTKQNSLDSEIKTLERQKERVLPKEVGKTNRHFDTLVDINLRNLEDYYELVKNSNKKSFIASITVSVLGFLLIVGGLITSYLLEGSKDISYVAASAGVIVEIVAGLMFHLYSKTILQLKEYHDSLLNVQNMLLSFKLFEDHKKNDDSSEILKQMIGYLLASKSENEKDKKTQ